MVTFKKQKRKKRNPGEIYARKPGVGKVWEEHVWNNVQCSRVVQKNEKRINEVEPGKSSLVLLNETNNIIFTPNLDVGQNISLSQSPQWGHSMSSWKLHFRSFHHRSTSLDGPACWSSVTQGPGQP